MSASVPTLTLIFSVRLDARGIEQANVARVRAFATASAAGRARGPRATSRAGARLRARSALPSDGYFYVVACAPLTAIDERRRLAPVALAVLVTARYLNSTVAPGARPAIVVLACSVDGAVTHVLPPSVLYCHSYDARRPAVAATTFALPETAPGFAAKTRARRVGVLRTATPALSMMAAPFSGAGVGRRLDVAAELLEQRDERRALVVAHGDGALGPRERRRLGDLQLVDGRRDRGERAAWGWGTMGCRSSAFTMPWRT